MAPSRTPSLPRSTPTASTSPSPAVTLTGVVIEGLRPTCRVLQTGSRRFVLLGPGTDSLSEGDHVTVTGSEQPNAHHPCGQTFVVTRIKPSGG